MRIRIRLYNTYLSEFFLNALGGNYDSSHVLKVLKQIDNEIAYRNKLSEISYQELQDLWDVLKDFSSTLIENKDTFINLYNKIKDFTLSTKGAA